MLNVILMSAALFLSPAPSNASSCCDVQAACCKPGAACCDSTANLTTKVAVEAKKEGEKKEGGCDGCKEGDKAKDGDKAKEGKKDKEGSEKPKDKKPN
jgi:hypothetical protein